MVAPAIKLDFDAARLILHVGLAATRFDTKATVDSAFEAIRRYWRANCGGKKVYALIDYTGVQIEAAIMEYYAAAVKRIVEECSITAVRYSDDVLTRSKLRRISVMIHKPSNLYDTRAEALEVVEAIRTNKLPIQNAS